MKNIQNLVDGLMNSDNKKAYQSLIELERESCQSAVVYPFFHVFADMLDNENSYIRTRGIRLIAVNARWDRENKIDEIIDRLLKHILDDKPVTARQCIKSLPVVARCKPYLRRHILDALHCADPKKYKDSMQSLVGMDIEKCLLAIQNMGANK